MERSRLKNIIILILVLVNAALLFSLGFRRTESLNSRSRTTEELTELFAREGISLRAKLPADTPPAGKTLERSIDRDRALAAAALGDELTVSDEGGGIYTCFGSSGQAYFHANGSFSISGTLAADNPEAFCRKFCKAGGYQDFTYSVSGGSGSGSAVQYFEGYPVVDAAVGFRVENGVLVSISGTHLPSTFLSSGDRSSMTSATALTRFLVSRRESGTVVSEVSDVYLCYELQSTTAAPMTLSPAWCIVTDTFNYYVNCLTGGVTHD